MENFINEEEHIFVSGPSITDKEIAYVTDAVRSAWYADANKYNVLFEDAFKQYTGRKYAISLPSCTSALHLALLSLGISSGDEVIVPEITWIATSAPITYVGATPVFCDVKKDTWCIAKESFEAAITEKTKAVIVVDLYGNIPEMDEILKLAEEKGIFVIEDAAEAAGARYKDKPAGAFGKVSTFSFHGSKTLTTGEGGMLLCDDEEIYNKCLFLRDHGRKPGDKMFFNAEVAYKYKMSSMQAALGLAQIERIDELVKQKRDFFNHYKNNLKDVQGLALNISTDHVYNSYWMNTVILDESYGLTGEQVIENFSNHNIDTRSFFHPLSSIPAYKEYIKFGYAEKNPVSYAISKCAVNLPSGFDLTEAKIQRVCSILKKML